MALTSAWMSACDIDGVKTQTYGPNVAVTASGQRLAGDGSALACSAPAAVAVSAAAPKSAALTMRRATRCLRHLTRVEFHRPTCDERRARGKTKLWTCPEDN